MTSREDVSLAMVAQIGRLSAKRANYFLQLKFDPNLKSILDFTWAVFLGLNFAIKATYLVHLFYFSGAQIFTEKIS